MTNLHIDKINFIRWNTVDSKRGLKDLLIEVYGDKPYYFNHNNYNYGYYLDEVSKTNFDVDYLNWYIENELRLDDYEKVYFSVGRKEWLCDLCRKGYIKEGLYILDN